MVHCGGATPPARTAWEQGFWGAARDGVGDRGASWRSAKGWWLLPVDGPAIPMVRFLPYPPQVTTVTPPYPGSSNEAVMLVQIFIPGGGSQQNTVWWNLGEGGGERPRL